MKKKLFASAFALIGTFALANEVKNSEKNEESNSEKVETLQIVCVPVQLSCTEDCFMMDTEIVYTSGQIAAELKAQDDYVCGG